jgi:site-specific DNA-cytosine methylase
MKRERSLHKQVRVVYRACRRLYGIEKAQDECLRVFKVVFPEIYRLRESENERETLSENIRFKLQEIVKSWQPKKRLRDLTERVDDLIAIPFDYDRQELIQFLEDIIPVAMRIRKLTPRECFRLMDVGEEDIDKLLESGLSNSALYRLAGNSIVISPMVHIFDKLFIHTEQEKKAGMQLMLF